MNINYDFLFEDQDLQITWSYHCAEKTNRIPLFDKNEKQWKSVKMFKISSAENLPFAIILSFMNKNSDFKLWYGCMKEMKVTGINSWLSLGSEGWDHIRGSERAYNKKQSQKAKHIKIWSGPHFIHESTLSWQHWRKYVMTFVNFVMDNGELLGVSIASTASKW